MWECVMMCTLCVQGASVSLQWDFLNVITLISGKKYFNELETLQIGSNPDKQTHPSFLRLLGVAELGSANDSSDQVRGGVHHSTDTVQTTC